MRSDDQIAVEEFERRQRRIAVEGTDFVAAETPSVGVKPVSDDVDAIQQPQPKAQSNGIERPKI